MYRIATLLVKQFWGQPRDLADGVGVLLLTWNQAHYRYGLPDLMRFEKFLIRNGQVLEELRRREISTFSATDEPVVKRIFTSALAALEIRQGSSKGRRSPVGVAKALHLLAPSFLPIWDKEIAKAYSCAYGRDPVAAYLKFMTLSKWMAEQLSETIDPLLDGKTPLKVIDEYNYARFTKQWA